MFTKRDVRALVIGLLAPVCCFTAIYYAPTRHRLGSVHSIAPSDSVPLFVDSFPLIIDLPKLAFLPKTAVDRVLGKPIKTVGVSNPKDWWERAQITTYYHRAECTFLSGRLVNVIYSFDKKKRPHSAREALMSCGFPSRAADLDTGLPWRAKYAGNPGYRNPLRCCGLVFHWVALGENLDEIIVVFASLTDHFDDWPEEFKQEWRHAGGPALSDNPLDWPIQPRRSHP
jgi:hypothetical protein